MAENQVDNDVENREVSTADELERSNVDGESDEDSLDGFEDGQDEEEDDFEEDEGDIDDPGATTSNGDQPVKRKRKKVEPNKRKRIRRILREDELTDVTISAQKEEKERLRRLELQRSLAAAASGILLCAKTSENVVSSSAATGSKPASPVAIDVREKKAEQPHVIVIDSDEEGEIDTSNIDCRHRMTPSDTSSGDLIEIISSDSEIEVGESDDDDNDDDNGCENNDVDYNNSGTHVDDTVNQADPQGKVLVNVNHPADEEDIFLAPQIVKVIKPHQIGGVRFLYDNLVETIARYKVSLGFGCILAHAMGLGKTLQVISFIDVFLRYTPAKKVLCVVPINTIQNWLAEFNMWLPPKPDLITDGNGTLVETSDSCEVHYRHFEVFLLGDNQKSTLARAKVIGEWNQHGGVLLMGYELFRLLSTATPSMSSSKSLPTKKKKSPTPPDKMNGEPEVIDLDEEEKHMELLIGVQKALCNPGADLVICDEGHRIKNDQANTSQALKKINTKRRVVLTGYPLQNNLQEYWCMVDFVRPNFLGTKPEFCNMFERPILNGQCSDSTPSDVRVMRYRAHVLHSLLEGFVQRRSQAVLKKCLPSKEEHIILVNMSPIQKELYNTFVEFLMQSVGHVNPVKGFHTCTKIWNHPDIFYRSLDIKSNGKRNESPLTILDDGSETRGANNTSSLPNSLLSFPAYSPTNQQMEANATSASTNLPNQPSSSALSPYFTSSVTGYSQGLRSSMLTQPVALGPQLMMQAIARSTAQIQEVVSQQLSGGVSAMSASPSQAMQCLGDRALPVIQPAPQQPAASSSEGRPLVISEMDWAQKVFKDYQLGVMENGGKLVVLMEIIQESLKMGEKILIFSQSLSTLSVIEEFLGKQDVPFFPGRVSDPLKPSRWARNKSYYRLDGSTAAQERERLINKFNVTDNNDILLFMLSTRAGCLGINLIGASRVVVFDASWNPCHDVQAVCRVYRYGQKKPVHIYRLISTGTMEKKIYDRQVSKQGMADRVVDELNPEANFTKQEIMKLICEKEPVSNAPDLLAAADQFSDPVLVRLCRQCSRWVAKVPFKHDSLLVDRKELKLTKAEKREAKKGYEMEKRMATQGSRYCPGVIQPVFNRNHLQYPPKPPCPVKPVGVQAHPSTAAGFVPQGHPQHLNSSLYVPLASLIRAGALAPGQRPNPGGIPFIPTSTSTNNINSTAQPNQQASASNEQVVTIDLDELPSPTKLPAQEAFLNPQVPPLQGESIDSLVRRARNAFPNVSPALIGYLLNQGNPGTCQANVDTRQGTVDTCQVNADMFQGNGGTCQENPDTCKARVEVQTVDGNDEEVAAIEVDVVVAGSSSSVQSEDASAIAPVTDPGVEPQSLKELLVTSPSPQEKPEVLASPSPPQTQEVPPNLDQLPDSSAPQGEASADISTSSDVIPKNSEQTKPSDEENG